ncbi:MAG: undecaprenyldiphospho-muramoylpentapeptide beta-N-acetylglucosaminyltransferase [Desulfobulbus sp.]|jgi:UDP-N-acetylglucosamine--N-acetylmuramyl-(pentapeptide) pyrophosphoryl-undecaprenol N-acetylglucosamine transferase|uniref:undecaprenyldiphospho-muramoylpentapeptide beta-N-acetylglucosaminyltransferase n=1 Tax=Desulfobulbus sp. TaxID=895 RepID=UPI002849AF40|nr:undecaprenyldiphospho-muramoylpentapeptide beta-N-acetylglucosaminyltransferase [Desulfobulbus sp.]MDR2548832.1 undecaprenyldiphospho-muramoylpentapeptide beta-N-acetylglucosaminyltransferase [Desulfobulbus sp.]
MRLIVAGGGTGGHLFPGIAVATAVRERLPESRVLFIGTSRLLDQQALAGLGFELAALECGGVKGLAWAARLRSLALMPKAVIAALEMLRRFQPDLVFGVGGYVTGPVLLAAKLLRIPIAIHEQNSVPGMANRLAGKLADLVLISLPCTPPFPPRKTIQTGNPLRREILTAAGRKKEAAAVPTVLVLGGSQGAHRVNVLMMAAVEKLQAQHIPFRLIHQTGEADREQVTNCYAQLGVEAEVSAFIRDMAGVYGRADLAVSRAGATTCAELAAMGLPALLIPYPFAADDHQATNGEYYAKGGGCRLLRESGLTGEILAGAISEYLQNRAELHTMAADMKAMAMPDATEQIVDACVRLIARRGRRK